MMWNLPHALTKSLSFTSWPDHIRMAPDRGISSATSAKGFYFCKFKFKQQNKVQFFKKITFTLRNYNDRDVAVIIRKFLRFCSN